MSLASSAACDIKIDSSAATTGPTSRMPLDKEGNPLKPCCACPDTRRERDDCVLFKGEENCHEFIEKHRACLQSYGFIV